jgi:APA family basic amino acid/polyamine antiporter
MRSLIPKKKKPKLKEKKPRLKRTLGLWETTLCGVGIILGAGIYALVGKAAGLGGSAVWISFLIAALVAAFTGLSYAELSSMFPKAGAEYDYSWHAFGRGIAFIVGWLLIFGGIISAAAVALGFAGYFKALFGTSLLLVAIILILISSFILMYGIKESAILAVVFTIIEMIGLLIIIFIGIPHLGDVNYLQMPQGLNGVFMAAALIFFAYIGFEDIARLSEETKHARTIVPKAILLSIGISTVLYVLVAFSAISVLGWKALYASNAPLADVAASAFGPKAFILLSVIALFATANTVLLILLATSRVLYGMADEKSLPKILSKIHPTRQTPIIAILFCMIFGVLALFLGDIEVVANTTNFTIFITFIVINAAVIWLRFKSPDAKRPFKMPVNIGKFPVLPFLGLITCIFLLSNLTLQVITYGMVLTVVGIGIYAILKKMHYHL